MPCSKGMTACRPDCGHRRFVADYRAERDAQTVRAESATKGYARELGEFFDQAGRAVERRVLFRDFLATHQGADYPYPSVWGMTLTLTQDIELTQWISDDREAIAS